MQNIQGIFYFVLKLIKGYSCIQSSFVEQNIPSCVIF